MLVSDLGGHVAYLIFRLLGWAVLIGFVVGAFIIFTGLIVAGLVIAVAAMILSALIDGIIHR